MTDINDRASEAEQEMRDDALSEQQRRSGLRGKSFLDSARNCRVCDETLPLARRQAVPGVHTCLACQQEIEATLKESA
jgi:phage/conjugal plasmid C-4 type zinc finger TraR family protein